MELLPSHRGMLAKPAPEIMITTPLDVAPPEPLGLAQPQPGVEHEQHGEMLLRSLRLDRI